MPLCYITPSDTRFLTSSAPLFYYNSEYGIVAFICQQWNEIYQISTVVGVNDPQAFVDSIQQLVIGLGLDPESDPNIFRSRFSVMPEYISLCDSFIS